MGEKIIVKPEILSPETDKNRIEILKNSAVVTKIDLIENLLEELFFIKNPSLKFSNLTKDSLKSKIATELGVIDYSNYGNWVFYPWINKLVHLPPSHDYQLLRTTRNRYLITEAEQENLAKFQAGLLGMSVGNSIALSIVYSGISDSIKIADPDFLDGTNLNRIRASVADLNLNKTVIAARQIYEINPYAKVEIFPNGVDSNNLQEFLKDLDLLIEETDDFELKVNSRLEARKVGIPVVMITDNAEEVMVDIERYDLDKNYPIFHGFAGDIENLDLRTLTKEKRIEIATKIVGKENISPRMVNSLQEVGKTLVSWPQLATTVFAGGGIGAYVVKQIALGESIKSKRFKINIDEKLLD